MFLTHVNQNSTVVPNTLQERVFLTPVNHNCSIHVPNTLQERLFLTPVNHNCSIHVPNTLQKRLFLTPVNHNCSIHVPNTLQERVFLYLQHLSPIPKSEEFNPLLSLRTRKGLSSQTTF